MVQAQSSKPKKSVALSGIAASTTELCTVGRSGNDLNYRGYDILDIADFMSSGLFNDGTYNAPSPSIAAVPEPAPSAMMLAGLACGGWQMFRRRHAGVAEA